MELTVDNFVGLPRESAVQSPQLETKRPVDLVHLTRYTLGNNTIEREVLGLFRTQSELFLQRLKRAASDVAWRQAAHTIKDSALGIGAWRVAKAAEIAETLDSKALSTRQRWVAQALEQQIEEANGFIDAILADA